MSASKKAKNSKKTIWAVGINCADHGEGWHKLSRYYQIIENNACEDILAQGEIDLPDLLLIDIDSFDDCEQNLDVIHKLRLANPFLPIITLSSGLDTMLAFHLGRKGASRLIMKSGDPAKDCKLVKDAVSQTLAECSLHQSISNIIECEDVFHFTTNKYLRDCSPVTQNAIKYFLNNISVIGPNVQAVARGCKCSHGTLNKYCKQDLHQSIGDFLTYYATHLARGMVEKGVSAKKASNLVGMSYERFRQRVQADYEENPLAVRTGT